MRATILERFEELLELVGDGGMKRFYRRVEVAAEGAGHRVLLDGRPLRTPARLTLALPSAALAVALAREWQAQGEVDPAAATMPLTRLASTAQDRMPGLRQAAIEEAVGYARTDLLCYRAAAPARSGRAPAARLAAAARLGGGRLWRAARG